MNRHERRKQRKLAGQIQNGLYVPVRSYTDDQIEEIKYFAGVAAARELDERFEREVYPYWRLMGDLEIIVTRVDTIALLLIKPDEKRAALEGMSDALKTLLLDATKYHIRIGEDFAKISQGVAQRASGIDKLYQPKEDGGDDGEYLMQVIKDGSPLTAVLRRVQEARREYKPKNPRPWRVDLAERWREIERNDGLNPGGVRQVLLDELGVNTEGNWVAKKGLNIDQMKMFNSLRDCVDVADYRYQLMKLIE